MQEYDFIPAVGQSNREFWNDANSLADLILRDPGILASVAGLTLNASPAT